jgi:hypothetical protein
METQLELDFESKRVLWACLQCAQQSPNPQLDQSICFSWVLPIFRQAYGYDFHQSRLRALAADGFLRESDSTRAGKRRYYTVTDFPSAERLAIR